MTLIIYSLLTANRKRTLCIRYYKHNRVGWLVWRGWCENFFRTRSGINIEWVGKQLGKQRDEYFPFLHASFSNNHKNKDDVKPYFKCYCNPQKTSELFVHFAEMRTVIYYLLSRGWNGGRCVKRIEAVGIFGRSLVVGNK